DVRLRFRGKLRTFHAEISAARLTHHTRFLAGGFDDTRQFPTDGLAEGDVRHHAVSKKSIYPVTRAVEELIRDHELQRLVLFFQRPDRGDGDDAFHAQLLEAVN